MTQPPSDDESPIEAKLAAPPPMTSYADTLESSIDQASGKRDSRKTEGGMFQGRVAVLSILFLVTGAIGIPLLWVSPHFTTGERILWSVIVALYTVALLVLAGGIIWWAYKQLFGLSAI
ncbi:MAG: hypothetical protein HKN47_18230 [Pirellulaceae bacterium]|nr:hypothetical protein [Pirellulaceae bacterium]